MRRQIAKLFTEVEMATQPDTESGMMCFECKKEFTWKELQTQRNTRQA